MRFFKLKTSLLALIFSIITLGLHLGAGYVLHFAVGRNTLANLWQHSLTIYWPALDLMRILGPHGNVGSLMGIILMIMAGLLELWVIFSVSIWLVRLYFRKPPINSLSKIAIPVVVLVAAVCFYKASPAAFGDPRGPLELAMDHSDVQAFEKILHSNPSLAKAQIRGDTPLNMAIRYPHPKEFIDLLVKYGADINATGWPFDETPLQAAAGEGKVEAVKALLAHHPEVNALHKEKLPAPGGYVVEDTDETALSYAFSADNKEIFKLLLDAGADINRGRSALAECMMYGGDGRDSWPEFLLTNGADPNRLGSKADRFLPIIQAVLNGNTNYVAALLRHHVDLSVRYINGADNFSPLELAMDEGHMDIALMIQDYALQSRSNTVSFAAARGDLGELRSLIQANPQSIEERDELGFTPLAWAAKAGQKEAASLLLSLGANPNATNSGGRYPIDWAATSGHVPLVKLLFDKTSNNQSVTLYFAIQQQQVPVAKFLLEHGANPNIHYPACNLGTPLDLAAGQGNVEAARLLLEHGADVNGQANGCGRIDYTPLDSAVGGSSNEMVKLLFADGATVPNKGSGYWSIFHEWALGAGDPNIADLLLSHKADVNARNSDGQTPLHFAAQQGQLQAVEWLLKHGADVNARDNKGVTPLSLTKYRNRGREIEKRKDVADLLRKYGAKE